jgi:hypothetical protein
MHSDPKPQIAQKQPIEWRGYGLLSSSRTSSPTALSLPVLSGTGTMSFEVSPYYADSMYKRLEESIFEYMDEDTIPMLVPALKKALCAELARRRDEVSRLEAVIGQLFPGEGYGQTQ